MSDAMKLVRKERLPTMWCNGCGINTSFLVVSKVLSKKGYGASNLTVVSGIGCAGRVAGYFEVDSVHATHGRALPVAESIARTRSELNVLVFSGDGDLSSIGGNHLLHSARRNAPMTVLMINNEIYGMTGGQASPLTHVGRITQTTPSGATLSPVNVQGIVTSAERYFYARTTVAHIKHLEEVVDRALSHRGFTFVEIISNCPDRFGAMNDQKSPAVAHKHYRDSYKIRKTGILRPNDLGIMTKE